MFAAECIYHVNVEKYIINKKLGSQLVAFAYLKTKFNALPCLCVFVGINNSPFEWYVNCPQEIEVEEGAALDARKLKLTYSFDRMKERKQLESERARQKMLDQVKT